MQDSHVSCELKMLNVFFSQPLQLPFFANHKKLELPEKLMNKFQPQYQ